MNYRPFRNKLREWPQTTRIPESRPGAVVALEGKLAEVEQLCGAITGEDGSIEWRIVLGDGRRFVKRPDGPGRWRQWLREV